MQSATNDLDSFGQTIDMLSVTQIKQPFDFTDRLYINDARVREIPHLEQFLDFRFQENWKCQEIVHHKPDENRSLKEVVRHTKAVFEAKLRDIGSCQHQEENMDLLQYDDVDAEHKTEPRNFSQANNGFACFNPDGSLRLNPRNNDASDESTDSFADRPMKFGVIETQYRDIDFKNIPVRLTRHYGPYWEQMNDEAVGFESGEFADSVTQYLLARYAGTRVKHRLRQMHAWLQQNECRNAVREPTPFLKHVCLEHARPHEQRPEYGVLDFTFPVELQFVYDRMFGEVAREQNKATFILTRGPQGGWAFAICGQQQAGGHFSAACPVCTKYQLFTGLQFKDQAPFGVPSRFIPPDWYVLVIESQIVPFSASEQVAGELNEALRIAYSEVVGAFSDQLAGTHRETTIYANRHRSCVFFKQLAELHVLSPQPDLHEYFEAARLDFGQRELLIVHGRLSAVFFAAAALQKREQRTFIKNMADCMVLHPESAEFIAPFFFKYPMLNNYTALASVLENTEWTERLSSLRRSVGARKNEFFTHEVLELVENAKKLQEISSNAPQPGFLSISCSFESFTETFAILPVTECKADFASFEFFCFIRLLPQLFKHDFSTIDEYQKIIDVFRYQFTDKEIKVAFTFSEQTQTAVLWVFQADSRYDLKQHEAHYGAYSVLIHPQTSFAGSGNVFIATHVRFCGHQLSALVSEESGLPFMIRYEDKIPIATAETELGISLQKAEAYIDVLQVGRQKFSVALSEKIARLEGYKYVELSKVDMDLGLLLAPQQADLITPAFAEYLQFYAQFANAAEQYEGQLEDMCCLPVDSDSETSFVLDEFEQVKDVQDAIIYQFEHVQESYQLQSFLSALSAAAIRYSAVRCVWWIKCSGDYTRKYVISADERQQDIDELQHLGLFANNYECQFNTPMRVSNKSINFLACKAHCPVEKVRASFKRAYTFTSGWNQLSRK